MEYSKRITDLQTIYQLSPQDVFFCFCVACGATRRESYALIFRPQTSSMLTVERLASQLATDKPGINKLIESLKAINIEATKDRNAQRQDDRDRKKRTRAKEYRTKEAIITGLVESLEDLRGKERADVLIKIADLQQMKKEANAEEVERVHYYLPLSCYNCELLNNKNIK